MSEDRKAIPPVIIQRAAEYVTNKIAYQIMKAMSKDDILDRSYRTTLVFQLTKGYCELHKIEHDSEEATMVMSLIYSNIFNPIHLIFTEPIIQKFAENPCQTDLQIDTMNQLMAEGMEDDKIQAPGNVHDLREYTDRKVH